MSLKAALVDRARTVQLEPLPIRIRGATRFAAVHGDWFRCRLTLPAAPENLEGVVFRRTVIRVPTLLYGLRNEAGTDVLLTVEQRLEVNSNELGRQLWDVVHQPTPLRKKRRLLGWETTLRRVEDPEFPGGGAKGEPWSFAPIADDFDRPNGALGAGWRFGDWSQLGTPPTIVAHQVVGSDFRTSCVLETVSANAVAVKLTGGVNSALWVDLYLAGPVIDPATGYAFSAFHTAGVLRAQVTPFMGSSITFPDTAPLVAGDEIGFSVDAGRLYYFVRRGGGVWTLVGTGMDVDHAPSYRPGFGIAAPVSIDDFRAGPFVAPGG